MLTASEISETDLPKLAFKFALLEGWPSKRGYGPGFEIC